MAAYGTITPKRTRKSNAQTPTQGIKTSTETANPENRMLMMKFINDYLSSNYTIGELRDFAPIGMLEYWNAGIMGSGKMEKWVIHKTHINNEAKNIH